MAPRAAVLLATVGGVGYLPKAPGTAGSVVGLLIGFLTTSNNANVFGSLVSWVAGFVVGVITSARVARSSGQHDPSSVVVDELVGMWAVVLAIPFVGQTWWLAMVAFILFRAFDIIKPPPLRWLERRPGGWGIMLDDLGAAGYTALVFWVPGLVIPAFR